MTCSQWSDLNARGLTGEMLPYTPDLASIDVVFISLAKVLPAVLGCMAETYDVLAMVRSERAWVDRRDAPVYAGSGEHRRGIHLARQGSAGGARVHGRDI